MAVEKIKAFQIDTTEIVDMTVFNNTIDPLKVQEYVGGREGLPAAGAIVYKLVCVRDVDFPLNMVGSMSTAEVAATNLAVFSIQKNGVQFATFDYVATATSATFAGTSTSFAVGDVLTVVAPSPQDATLSDVWFNLVGTLA